MKKLLSAILIILALTALLASCGTPVNTNTDTTEKESKSLYELAVEAGFEGTLEEWCEAVANVNDTLEEKNESSGQNNITKGEAILIAQTHLFAVQPPECSLSLTYTAEYIRDDEETWTILVSKNDVNPNDGDWIIKGGGYTYVIEKSTGKILEITLGE